MGFMDWLLGEQPHPELTPEFCEHQLSNYFKKNKKKKIEQFYELMLEEQYDMNSVLPSGPLVCVTLSMGKFLSINMIDCLIYGGLDFGHPDVYRVAHKYMFRCLERNYTDTLWSVFVHLCQRTNFVETMPKTDMFEVIFGRIMITASGVYCQYNPHVYTIKLLLSYDNGRRIKKNFLQIGNVSLRHCIKQAHPEIYDCIINS